MRKFRITVDGTPYDVTVDELDDAGAAASGAPKAVAPPRPSAASTAPASAPVPAAPAAPSAPAASSNTPAGAGSVVSPLAGTVTRIDVAVGQQVQAGQTVLTLEAMKMNTAITAPVAGTVAAVSVAAGATVAEGQVLMTIS